MSIIGSNAGGVDLDMDCQNVEFSATKSRQRIERVSNVFGTYLLNRILAFALYLFGAKQQVVASLFGMPDDSLKTMLRVLRKDGFPALCDRRQTAAPFVPPPSYQEPSKPQVSLLVDDEFCAIYFGFEGCELKIPRGHKTHLRTVLLSLYQAGLLNSSDISSVLDITTARCRTLAAKLSSDDVVEALVDKREGQKMDFRVGVKEKMVIVKHYIATLVTGHSSSSVSLAKAIEKHDEITLSARTIRCHVNKLGLPDLKGTLPALIDTLKKNC